MAIKLCQQLGLLVVHVEGDAHVVNGILSPEVDWSSKGLMLERYIAGAKRVLSMEDLLYSKSRESNGT